MIHPADNWDDEPRVKSRRGIERLYQVVQKTLRKEEEEVVPWHIEENGVIAPTRKTLRFSPGARRQKLDFSKLYEIQPFLPPGMKILACSGKVFTVTWMLLGFQNFCLSLYMQEELISKVFQKVGEIQLQGARELQKIPNVGALWVVDDLSYGSGPMHPKFIRKYVFPWYEELAAIAKKQGLLLFFHSDGNIWSIMDDLIGIGFDAISSHRPERHEYPGGEGKSGKEAGDPRQHQYGSSRPRNSGRGAELTQKTIREIAPGGGFAWDQEIPSLNGLDTKITRPCGKRH